MDAQNASGRASGPSVDNSHTLDMAETFSQEKLEAAIQALPCISGSGITVTSDAHISAYARGGAIYNHPCGSGKQRRCGGRRQPLLSRQYRPERPA